MTKVGLFEAKSKLSELVRRADETGEEFLLTVRGKPMARILPAVDHSRNDVAKVFNEIEKFRKKVAKNAKKPLLKEGQTYSEMAHEGHKW